MGQNLFRSFATILIAWYGIKSALSAASGRSPFHFDNFASLLLTISFGFAMVNYYNAPIPGVGISFHNLVTNEAQFLSGEIDQAQLQTVIMQVADFESRIDSPTWGDILRTPIHLLVTRRDSKSATCMITVWSWASGGLRIPHGLSDVGRHSRNRHLRHRDHPARRGPGRGDCGHRLWVDGGSENVSPRRRVHAGFEV